MCDRSITWRGAGLFAVRENISENVTQAIIGTASLKNKVSRLTLSRESRQLISYLLLPKVSCSLCRKYCTTAGRWFSGCCWLQASVEQHHIHVMRYGVDAGLPYCWVLHYLEQNALDGLHGKHIFSTTFSDDLRACMCTCAGLTLTFATKLQPSSPR